MKKYWGALFVVYYLFVLSSGASAADLKDGFMGYKWGESASRYPELRILYTKGDITFYSNPGESYTIEDITVNDVVFGFYQQSLFAVYIGIDSLEIYDSIERHLRTKYGLPGTKVSAKDYLTTHKWKYQGVKMKLKTSQVDGKMKLGMYYNPLVKDLREDQIEDINERSYRFFPIDKNKRPERIPLLEF